MTDKDEGHGAWSKVPIWDGSPQTWRSFRREMAWWTSSLDLESTKKYNLAARWLLRQTGMVRARGEEFLPEELVYQPEIVGKDPETGEDVILTPADPLHGIKKLMKALEEMNGKTTLDKRGELRGQFYLELKRRPGERISEFCTRFRTMVADLKSEGVSLPSSELGWFLRSKLGLDPLRTQLLDTALGGSEDYEVIEREILRLFKDLHSQDPLARKQFGDGRPPLLQKFLNQQSNPSRASSYAPSMASTAPRSFKSSASSTSSRFSNRRPFPPPRQAMVSEVEDDVDGDEEHVDEGQDPQSLEELMQTEAEALAAELDAAAEEGVDEVMLQEIESSVETAAEALLTMREAKTRLQEVKRDRGYNKADGGDKKGTLAKKQSGKHPCFDCGLQGHWAGDPECQKPGQGLGRKPSPKKVKQVKLVESLNTEHVAEAEATIPPANEVLTVACTTRPAISDSLMRALDDAAVAKEVNALVSAKLACDKRLVGALDSACNRTCTGPEWLSGFLDGLKQAPQEIQDLVISRPERETFRFGNGGTQVSVERWRLPAVVGGTLICFWTSVVPVPSLGLLLGRDFLEAVGADMSFSRRTLKCESLNMVPIALPQLTAGHYLLHLLPSCWPGVVSQKRWKRLGVDGVLELQLSASEWLRKRFGGRTCNAQTAHDHLLTEHSLHAGRLVLAQASMSSASLKPTSTSTTSSSTRSCLSTQISHGDSVSEPTMASHGAAPARKKHVGGKRHSALARAKAIPALFALALSLSHFGSAVEGTGQRPGFGWNCPQESLAESGLGQQVHHGKPGRVLSPSESFGHSTFLHRGPQVGGHACWPSGQGFEFKAEKTSAEGSLGRSSTCRRERSSRARGENPDRPQGRCLL